MCLVVWLVWRELAVTVYTPCLSDINGANLIELTDYIPFIAKNMAELSILNRYIQSQYLQ